MQAGKGQSPPASLVPVPSFSILNASARGGLGRCPSAGRAGQAAGGIAEAPPSTRERDAAQDDVPRLQEPSSASGTSCERAGGSLEGAATFALGELRHPRPSVSSMVDGFGAQTLDEDVGAPAVPWTRKEPGMADFSYLDVLGDLSAHHDAPPGFCPPMRGVVFGNSASLLVTNEGGLKYLPYEAMSATMEAGPDGHVFLVSSDVGRAVEAASLPHCGTPMAALLPQIRNSALPPGVEPAGVLGVFKSMGIQEGSVFPGEGSFGAGNGDDADAARPYCDRPGRALMRNVRRCSRVGGPDSATESKCLVCLADMTASEAVLTLPCSHVLHMKCSRRHLPLSRAAPACPVCRAWMAGGR